MPTAKPTIWYPGIDRQHPLARGLLGYWPMWEGIGGSLGDLARANRGTLNGPVWAGSKYGNVLQLDGTDDVVNLASAPMTDVSQCTIFALINPDALSKAGGNRNEGIIRADDGGAAVFRLTLNGEFDAEFGLYIHNDAAGYYLAARTGTISGWTAGEWVSIAVVVRGANSSTPYFNGRSISWAASAGTGTAASMTTDWKVGDSELNNRYFTGQMGLVALYNRPLTASEVLRLHQDPFVPSRPRRSVRSMITPPPSGNPWWYYNMIARGQGA